MVTYAERHNLDNLKKIEMAMDTTCLPIMVLKETNDEQMPLCVSVKRNLFATLIFSHTAYFGDELSRTQNGNINAYCQDNLLAG